MGVGIMNSNNKLKLANRTAEEALESFLTPCNKPFSEVPKDEPVHIQFFSRDEFFGESNKNEMNNDCEHTWNFNNPSGFIVCDKCGSVYAK